MSHNSHLPQHPLAMPRRTPSPRPKRCSKRRYATDIEAKLEIARFQRMDDPRRSKLPCRAYKCPDCGGWHLTSQPEREPMRNPRNECGKAYYETKELADASLARIQANPHTPVVPVRSYDCPKCGKWHLTSKPLLKGRCVCGKTGWLHREGAQDALERIRANPDPNRRVPEGVALCEESQRWHLTF